MFGKLILLEKTLIKFEIFIYKVSGLFPVIGFEEIFYLMKKSIQFERFN